MRIAMIGQKGIPARYGGIERHVEEVSTRLVARGHEVLVYCRPYYTDITGTYKGVGIIKVPSLKTRHLDTATHTVFSTMHVLSMKPDIVHYHALGPSALSFIPRIAGAKTVVTVHGLDWRGGKWGRVATWLLQRCEYAACHFPNRTIVVSRLLKKYFEERYGRKVTYIPNGVSIVPHRAPHELKRFGLTDKGYYLFVGRLGPEKGCHVLVEGFSRSHSKRKLAIVGSAHLNVAYEETLKSQADERIVFTGELHGDLLSDLWHGAYAVIHPSITEGMSLSLLEAMAHAKCVIVSNIPENLDVVEDSAITFNVGDPEDLARTIDRVDNQPDLVREMGDKALTRVKQAYDWDGIINRLVEVYMDS